ncbi:MAG: divalent metal cation transporter [Firmicutes bacterium]|nr:divalent metal cation transporter [Alicyclobacillaceae bacterium]MCL6496598.1 divalent metal cation transporter [Bacillota bacterium]
MQAARFPSRPRPPSAPRPWAFIAVIGPGVLGLAADNDAGGMLSYLLTGAAHHLVYFWLELAAMAPVTYLVQELALRVALATHQPYGRILAQRFGRPWAWANGAILQLLNLCNLVTEFVGMASALNLFGVPWQWGVAAALALVLAATTWYRRYGGLERFLLALAGLNLSWVAALILSPFSRERVTLALGGAWNGHLAFLGLALAGNAIAPWMVYWQQNAVWAGQIQTLSQGRADIRIGVLAQVTMAALVMLIGGVAQGPVRWAHPLTWLAQANPWVARTFALGLFDAGFMAACTMTLASAWMWRETFGTAESARDRRPETPTRGRQATPIHWATLLAAAALTLSPGLNPGAVALWAQALGGLWMPASLVFLGLVAQDRRLMGPFYMRGRRRAVLGAAIALFLFLGIATVLSSL